MSEYSELITPETKRILAISCWHTEGFDINYKNPYKLKSKNMSPIYISTEQILGDPNVTKVAIALACAAIEGIEYDVIAGGEMRGALFAKDLATTTGKPFVLVRKLPKDYGTGTQRPRLIQCMKENDFADKTALLCEDMITDGKSKVEFITGIRDTGGYVNDCFVFADRQQGGGERLREYGVELYSLTDLDTLLAVGKEMGRIDDEGLKSIEEYRADPKAWNLRREYEWHEPEK